MDMIVKIALEHRFERTPDGAIWTRGVFGTRFWERYRDIFDEVHIIARVIDVEKRSVGTSKLDGVEIQFEGLPCYIGPEGYLRVRNEVKGRIPQIARDRCAYVLRVPGMIGYLVYKELYKRKMPYGVEVLGDPQDVFSSRASNHSLRGFFRWLLTRQLGEMCTNASGAAYVTERALQEKYPCKPYMIGISSVELYDEDYVHTPRRFNDVAKNLLFIGSLEQPYKGLDVLLEAVRICQDRSEDIHLAILGDGKLKNNYINKAKYLGLEDRVTFVGQLPHGKPVIEKIDGSDMFIMPSRAEGLPRAMIEAMARGLPCIGTRVGGIPELLGEEYLVRPGDVTGLAEKIISVKNSIAILNRASADNLYKARNYENSILQKRRNAFYGHILRITSDSIISKNMPEGTVCL